MDIKSAIHQRGNNWRYFIDLVVEEARAGLRAEASRGYLGVLWWVIEPIMYMSIFYAVFAHLMHRGDESYVLFLLTGLITWKWFHATLNTGANSLMSNAGLMNLVYVPKIIFPLTTIAINTFKFLIILSLFLTFLLFTPVQFSPAWLLLPLLVAVQLLLTVALTCLLAALMPFFPDLRVILDNLLLMLFFLSGIFFDISRMPTSIRQYLSLNPIAALIEMYRGLLLSGRPPDWRTLLLVVLLSMLILFAALRLLRRFDRIYPKIIY